MQNHVQFRLSGDFDLLRRSPGVEYFDSFTSSATPIRLLDCGAFDGDTIRSALREEVKLEEIVAIEPNPDNHRKLKQWAAISEISDRIRVVESAVASFPGLLNFSSNGDMTSSLAITDNRESVRKVRVVTIDQLCRELDWKPTHIKMDIEGAEKEALLGAATILKSLRPNLMISLEHAYDDLWSIPLLVNQLVNGYEFRIRHYSESGFDAVLYARPARD